MRWACHASDWNSGEAWGWIATRELPCSFHGNVRVRGVDSDYGCNKFETPAEILQFIRDEAQWIGIHVKLWWEELRLGEITDQVKFKWEITLDKLVISCMSSSLRWQSVKPDQMRWWHDKCNLEVIFAWLEIWSSGVQIPLDQRSFRWV